MSIRVISFDLDDTLWSTLPVLQRTEAALYHYLGQHCPEVFTQYDMATLVLHRQHFFKQRPHLHHDLTALRQQWLQQLLAHRDDAEWHCQRAMQIFLRWRSRLVPFPDVVPVLRVLRRQYTLVSLTNGNAEVEQTSLRGLFHYRLRSQEVGHKKPAPEIFQYLCTLCQVTPEEILHIGDNIVDDVDGAQKAGLHAIQICRYSHHTPSPHGAVPCIQNLHQLANVLPQYA